MVKNEKAATGIESIPVADIKKRLRTLDPAQFSADKPPKLYAEFNHTPRPRLARQP